MVNTIGGAIFVDLQPSPHCYSFVVPNKFENRNVIPWYFWITRRKSKSRAVVIYFLSRRYGTSPRFFPLFNNFKNTDIVLFRGSWFPVLDCFYLKLLPYFIKCFRNNLARYKNFIALNSDSRLVIPTNMILNLDDPTYSKTELAEIKNWENSVRKLGFQSTIICTTQYIHGYLMSNGVTSNIHVIPQGHSNIQSTLQPRNSKSGKLFNFVYISPSIDVTGDPHAGHNMWDASTLLLDIWPKVNARNARLHLIGRLGQNAAVTLSDTRIISHGLVSIRECSKLLPDFDVALYPRIHDNAWLPQKIVEYIGAGLPILAFDLVDTELVRTLKVGILVKSSDEFAHAIDDISNSIITIDEFRQSATRVATDFAWSSLATKYESTYQ